MDDLLDDYDPTMPMADRRPSSSLGDNDEVAADLDQAPRPLFLPDGTPNWERGFADGASAIRVWCGPDGVLTKVRVTPHWRDKVARARPDHVQHAAIEQSFMQVLALINMLRDMLTELRVEPSIGEPTEPAREPLSWSSFNRMTEELSQVREQIDRLAPEQGNGRWVGQRSTGRGASGNVTVELDERGSYSSIFFDSQWLQESRVGQISAGVIEAVKNAHDRHTAADYEPGERDFLEQRAQALRNEMTAMLRLGVVS